MIPIYNTTIKIIHQNAQKDYESIVSTGIKRLENTFESVMRIDYNMTNADYITVKQLSNEQFNSLNIMKLINAKKIFTRYTSNVDLAADIYAVFRNNKRMIPLHKPEF